MAMHTLQLLLSADFMYEYAVHFFGWAKIRARNAVVRLAGRSGRDGVRMIHFDACWVLFVDVCMFSFCFCIGFHEGIAREGPGRGGAR